MAARKAISKKIRFEIFKRDSFKCQYCGASAPETVLHIDHIKPVSKGGTNTITNLVTACAACNSGKSNTELSDDSTVKKQKRQLDELQERKEQLELMMKWEQELLCLETEKINAISAYWESQAKGYSLNERGLESLRKLVAKYPYDEIIKAIKIASQQYFKLDKNGEDYAHESINYAWNKIPGIIKINLSGGYDEDFAKMHYIKGILRNRLHYCDERLCVELMKKAKKLDVSLDSVQELAKSCRNWTEWRNAMENYIEKHKTSEDGEL
jgi:hypothetical protein